MVLQVEKFTKRKRKIDYLYNCGTEHNQREYVYWNNHAAPYTGTELDELLECVNIKLIKVDVNNLPTLASD